VEKGGDKREGYTSCKKVVWEYDHTEKDWKFAIHPKWKFNSSYISGAQRLPNGNTLSCEGGKQCPLS